MRKWSFGSADRSNARCSRAWFQDLMVIAVLLSLNVIATPVQANAQAVQCSEQKIVGNDPRNNAKLVLCMPALRNDPAIVAIIDMLNRLNESNQQSAPHVQELVSSLANTTGNLNAKQRMAMADNIAKQLLPALQQSDARALHAIDGLKIGMEEVQQKLSIMLEAKGAQASIKEAMNGATGDAIVRLEFEEANKTLDKMLNSLTTIEGRLKSSHEADPALFFLTKREAEAAWGRVDINRAKRLCPQDWQSVIELRNAAIDEEKRGDIRTAGSSYDELKARIEVVNTALGLEDFASQMDKRRFEARRNVVIQIRNMEWQKVRTAEARNAFAKADENLAQAENLASKNMFQEATTKLGEAHYAYMSLAFPGRPAPPPPPQAPQFVTTGTTTLAPPRSCN